MSTLDVEAFFKKAPKETPQRESNTCTPTEAAHRWCPFVRIPDYQVGSGGSNAVNRSFENEDTTARGSNCIGPACMAWRWERRPSWREDGRKREERRGYCGLAGRDDV